MAIRLSLNNKRIYEVPRGLDALSTSIKLDSSINARFVSEDATLTFYSDGYLFFKALDDVAFCGEVKIRIEEDAEDGQWKEVHEGIVHLPACEFGIAPFYVKCPIDDNSFFTRINKNKSLKAILTNDRSKNNVAIVPAAYDVVEFFRPSSGVYSYPTRYVYSFYEVFRFLVDWDSDGEVGFVSDIFSTGVLRNFGLIRGAELRDGLHNLHDKQPELSFATAFEETFKKFRLMISTEVDANEKPMIRIENEEYYFKNVSASAVLNNCRNIKQRVNVSKIFAAVNCGSDKIDDSSGAVQYPESTRWTTFKTEQYPTLGQCNIDTELNLVSSWIISSNVIEQIVVNNLFDYDDDLIMIQYDHSTLKAVQSNWLGGTPPFFYNEELKNDKVVNRFLSGIPSSIANFLGTAASGLFKAHCNIDRWFMISLALGGSNKTPFIPQNDFSGVGYDVANNYGGATAQGILIPSVSLCKYTAPQGGFYRFKTSYRSIIHHHSNGSSANYYLIVTRYNSANAVVSTQNFFYAIPSPIFSNTEIYHEQEFEFLLNATDYVKVDWRISKQNGNNPNLIIQSTIKSDSSFECTYTSFGGGVWATIQSADFYAYEYQIKHPINKLEFESIKNNSSAPILFNTDGATNYKAWIQSMTFHRLMGFAEFTLISSHNLKPN